MLKFNLNDLTGTMDLDGSLNDCMARTELLDEVCHLKHGPTESNTDNPQAIDYLCQYFGFNKEKSITELLRIPICEECIQGLYDPNWALLYCVTCNSSQWVWKPDSIVEFNTEVVWLDMCPVCIEKSEEKKID